MPKVLAYESPTRVQIRLDEGPWRVVNVQWMVNVGNPHPPAARGGVVRIEMYNEKGVPLKTLLPYEEAEKVRDEFFHKYAVSLWRIAFHICKSRQAYLDWCGQQSHLGFTTRGLSQRVALESLDLTMLRTFPGVAKVETATAPADEEPEFYVDLKEFKSNLHLGRPGDENFKKIPIALTGTLVCRLTRVLVLANLRASTPKGERRQLPHVSGGQLCLGGAEGIYGLEMRSGRFVSAVMSVLVMLRELNEGGYMANAEWYHEQAACPGCGKLKPKDEVGAYGCLECAITCASCGESTFRDMYQIPATVWIVHARCYDRCGFCDRGKPKGQGCRQKCEKTKDKEKLWAPNTQPAPPPNWDEAPPLGAQEVNAALERIRNAAMQRVAERVGQLRGEEAGGGAQEAEDGQAVQRAADAQEDRRGADEDPQEHQQGEEAGDDREAGAAAVRDPQG